MKYHLDEGIQQCAQETVRECVLLANQTYRRRIRMPAIDFGLKGRCAGQLVAKPISVAKSSYIIRINGDMLIRHFEYFMREVIPHEVAHLVVHWIYGARAKAHGEEWKTVMKECFGLEPSIYHALPTRSARHHAREYIYQCVCQNHAFTLRRHKNAERGAKYLCRHCGMLLKFRGRAQDLARQE